MTAARSDLMALKPCPFCCATPHKGVVKATLDQSGDGHQDFAIWCPKGHAKVKGPSETLACEEWNARAASQPDREALLRAVMDWSVEQENLPPFYQHEGEELTDAIISLLSGAGTKSDGGVEGHARSATPAATVPQQPASGTDRIEAPVAGIKPSPSDTPIADSSEGGRGGNELYVNRSEVRAIAIQMCAVEMLRKIDQLPIFTAGDLAALSAPVGEPPLTASVLADALECFWNAAIGSAHSAQQGVAEAGNMAEGFAAVARRLKEHTHPPAPSVRESVTIDGKTSFERIHGRIADYLKSSDPAKYITRFIFERFIDVPAPAVGAEDVARALKEVASDGWSGDAVAVGIEDATTAILALLSVKGGGVQASIGTKQATDPEGNPRTETAGGEA